MNDKGDYRTAPATPGLLKTINIHEKNPPLTAFTEVTIGGHVCNYIFFGICFISDYCFY